MRPFETECSRRTYQLYSVQCSLLNPVESLSLIDVRLTTVAGSGYFG